MFPELPTGRELVFVALALILIGAVVGASLVFLGLWIGRHVDLSLVWR